MSNRQPISAEMRRAMDQIESIIVGHETRIEILRQKRDEAWNSGDHDEHAFLTDLIGRQECKVSGLFEALNTVRAVAEGF